MAFRSTKEFIQHCEKLLVEADKALKRSEALVVEAEEVLFRIHFATKQARLETNRA